MINENEKGAGGHGPDLTKIECTNCKYKGFFFWKGKEYEVAGSSNCEKYEDKPKGVLFPIKKDLHDRKGTYTKCPYFEKKEDPAEK